MEATSPAAGQASGSTATSAAASAASRARDFASEADGQWLRDLTPPAGSEGLAPATHPPLVAEVRSELGDGPVAWAVALGHEMATRIISEIPALGGGEESFQTLRMGTESATLRSMLLLVSNDPARVGVTDEALEGDRDFVRRGVSLDQVLRGIRLGHSLMAHGFLEAASDLVDEPRRPAEMKRTSDLLFEYIDDFASSMATEYLAERDRWVTSAAAERDELVRAILDNQAVDQIKATAVLGYPLGRHHQALVLWHDGDTPASPTDLQRAAARMLKNAGSGPSLMVPHGASSLWVWAAWKTHEHAGTRLHLDDAPGVRAAVGSPARGLDGFRASHYEAAAAAELIRTARPPSFRLHASSVTHYADVELVVLVTQNPTLAAAFIARELGPTAGAAPSSEELRDTVAAYLAYDRSLVKAAEHLHVARNTVAYRVKKFETLTGRDLKQRRLELEVALRMTSAAPFAIAEGTTSPGGNT